ncbi:MAG: hypothetical protein HY706_22580 [Candidatus Hydrogenedentes bacterium]|nr:hypothetical protein [Candidatus Hydrogenedentota bacterium]
MLVCQFVVLIMGLERPPWISEGWVYDLEGTDRNMRVCALLLGTVLLAPIVAGPDWSLGRIRLLLSRLSKAFRSVSLHGKICSIASLALALVLLFPPVATEEHFGGTVFSQSDIGFEFLVTLMKKPMIDWDGGTRIHIDYGMWAIEFLTVFAATGMWMYWGSHSSRKAP